MNEETRPLLGSQHVVARSDRDSNGEEQQTRYKASNHRWFMLTALSLLNFSNGMIWITFSPIADVTAEYYDVGAAKVNWLAIVFMLVAVVLGFVAIWMLDNRGLKQVIHLGAWLNFAGAAVRLMSIFETVPLEARYWILLAGQSIAALAQPFALFAPTKLAAVWFPHSQRAKANMICSMANPLGIMTANILSPLIATSPQRLFWVLELYCVPAGLTLFLVYMAVTSSRPAHAPSPSADEASEAFLDGIKKVARNRYFWVLAVSFGGGVALFTTLSTLIQQILCPRGYSDEFAGLCGALLLGAGLVGAAIASAVVDKTKKFEETAKVCFCVAVLFAIVFAYVSTLPRAEPWIALCIAGLGAFGFAVYPVSLELSVETTYPVAEATSSGLLMLSGQVQSVVYILLMQGLARPMSSQQSACHTSGAAGVSPQDYVVSDWVFAGLSSAAAVLLTIFYKCEYRRLHTEQILMAQGLVPATISSDSHRRSIQRYDSV